MSTSVIHFQLPRLCARCGAQQQLFAWKISTAQTGLHWASFFLIVFGLILTSTERVTFNVPVCAACKARLDRIRKIAIALQIGLILAFVALLLFIPLFILLPGRVVGSLSVDVVLGPFAAVIAVIIVAIVLAQRATKLAAYDGTFFTFKNDEFQRQFTKLNPELVSPRGHEQEKYFR